MLLIEYPKCSTCKKAKKWLNEHGQVYESRHIVDHNPSYEELKSWHKTSGLALKRFFNTSGVLYREMQLKDRLPLMTEEEMLRLLASNGMLVKRPLLIGDDQVWVGFKESQWKTGLKLE